MTSVKRTPIEKRPLHPLPKVGWAPNFGIPYKVWDNETWGSIARDIYNRDGFVSDTPYYDHDEQARFLMEFNFHTNNPNEINWYLHHYVGCKHPSHDLFNWKFSSDAKPGIIYLTPPAKAIQTQGIAEIGITNKLAQALEDAERGHKTTEALHLGLDIAEFAHIGLAMAEIEVLGVGGLALEISGPAMGLALSLMAIGMGHLEAIDEIKTAKVKTGISHGVVLGSAAESWQFMRKYFVDRSADFNANYPEQRKNFQATYLWGLTHGIAYGHKLLSNDRFLFFKHLDSRTGYRPPGNFYNTRGVRPEDARYQYYLDVAGEFLKESDMD